MHNQHDLAHLYLPINWVFWMCKGVIEIQITNTILFL
jgi:hypothetical protein